MEFDGKILRKFEDDKFSYRDMTRQFLQNISQGNQGQETHLVSKSVENKGISGVQKLRNLLYKQQQNFFRVPTARFSKKSHAPMARFPFFARSVSQSTCCGVFS